MLITITECLLAFAPLEPHFRHFCNILCCQSMFAALLKKNKVKYSNKTLCSLLLCNMLTLVNIMKRFYNLQVDFSKRPQYTRAKLSHCTRETTSSHFPRQRKLLPPVYKRATSFRYSTYVDNWLYVCRHGC